MDKQANSCSDFNMTGWAKEWVKILNQINRAQKNREDFDELSQHLKHLILIIELLLSPSLFRRITDSVRFVAVP